MTKPNLFCSMEISYRQHAEDHTHNQSHKKRYKNLCDSTIVCPCPRKKEYRLLFSLLPLLPIYIKSVSPIRPSIKATFAALETSTHQLLKIRMRSSLFPIFNFIRSSLSFSFFLSTFVRLFQNRESSSLLSCSLALGNASICLCSVSSLVQIKVLIRKQISVSSKLKEIRRRRRTR